MTSQFTACGLGALAMCLSCVSPAFAQDYAALLGPHGCTIGTDAPIDPGFDLPQARRWAEAELAAGRAEQHGDWIVLSPEVCQITLPELDAPFAMTHPIIDAARQTGRPFPEEELRCYVSPREGINAAINDPERAFDAFMSFIGANLVSGDLRFYSSNALVAPITFRDMTGECADLPGTADLPSSAEIAATHADLAAYFAQYVRANGANTICGGDSMGWAAIDALGIDMAGKNAMMFFEMDLITMAAGWWEGQSALARGGLRPPMCHYGEG